jgi:hypothetical protein
MQEEIKVEVAESHHKPQVVPVPFQQLYVSCPDGLAVNYYTDCVTSELFIVQYCSSEEVN